jgi:hypothetical protein
MDKVDTEEVINGLQQLRKKATDKEAEYLDIAANCVYILGELQEMITERRGF